MAAVRRASASEVTLAAGRPGIATRAASGGVVLGGGGSAAVLRADSTGVLTKRRHTYIAPVEPPVSPMLTHYNYIIGGANASFYDVQWTVPGYMTMRVRNMSGGATRTSAPTPLGTDYYRIIISSLTVGATYQLDWQLNCEPDVAGWDDAAWHYTGFQWVQPSKFETPLDGDGPIAPIS